VVCLVLYNPTPLTFLARHELRRQARADALNRPPHIAAAHPILRGHGNVRFDVNDRGRLGDAIFDEAMQMGEMIQRQRYGD
jgi:hypothetical protein